MEKMRGSIIALGKFSTNMETRLLSWSLQTTVSPFTILQEVGPSYFRMEAMNLPEIEPFVQDLEISVNTLNTAPSGWPQALDHRLNELAPYSSTLQSALDVYEVHDKAMEEVRASCASLRNSCETNGDEWGTWYWAQDGIRWEGRIIRLMSKE
ncbi:hypothetical protein M231_04086 [Tremella mesenterica]|uniref:Uncharacterized protein n=2 Tax=Tremella mesenterica TaxID=5217 RepID=A0A4Q1BLL8_TREME|nr:hypothetical protein M231_04086 [Tremella mesenterica]